ncbi:MAG TPA: hypothetical protein VF171_00015 [Trueperaceae bacterium]
MSAVVGREGMARFTIGEEVLYDGDRYVLAAIDTHRPNPYRLLATTRSGARFVWAHEGDLRKIRSYTEAGG